MLQDKMAELKQAIDAKRAEAQTAYAAFEAKRAELKDNDQVDITNPEDPFVKAADEAMRPYSQAADDLAVLQSQFERLALMEAAGGAGVPGADIRRENDIDRGYAEARETLGHAAANSDSYKALLASGMLNDGSEISLGGPKQISEPQTVKQFASLLTGTSDAAGGALNVPERFPGVYELPLLPLNILQLVTIGETSQNSVEFVRLLARTINAAEVAEASSTADIGDGTGGTATATQGGVKPESGLTFEEVLEGVKTIAHWIPATRNQLADAPFLRTMVDSELLDGVTRRAESQIISGSGSGVNMRGILNTTGRATYTQGAAASGEPMADAVHRIFTMLRLAGYEPSGLASHPNDWQKIRLSKDTNGNYIWGPPSQAGTDQIWGVRNVQTIAVPAGKAVAGEWKRDLFLVREGAKVLISDSHKDWFTRNLLALLAEARAVNVIPRPQAFGELTYV